VIEPSTWKRVRRTDYSNRPDFPQRKRARIVAASTQVQQE